MNLLEGLASLEEGPSDDEIRAQLAAQGIDMDAWADEIKAKAEAQLRAEEAKRKERAGGEGGTWRSPRGSAWCSPRVGPASG